MTWRRLCYLLLVATPGVSAGQSFVVDLPLKSQRAAVSQTIGLTDVTIIYHRPLVNGRAVWDSLVPYGTVWRTGANMNTTITFSDPVTIEGQPLDQGTYGLHMIPTAHQWTIIFSKNSTSWGSFTYNPAEDALRVTVTPKAVAMHDALTFEFDALQPASAVVEMEWERVAVPFTVAVDAHEVAMASLRRQLRTLVRYTWMSWDEAANYLLAERIALDTALAYTGKSIDLEDRYDNEMTRSKVLVALNRTDEAAAARRKALDLGTPAQVDQFARELLAAKRGGEAFAVFRSNARKHPDQWFVHDGLARVYSGEGKFGDAEKEMRVALAGAPGGEKSKLDGLVKQLQSRRDINQ